MHDGPDRGTLRAIMLMRPPLCLALAGLSRDPAAPWSGGPRAVIHWAASQGFRFVQLDGADRGVRARDLDRSARRDLAALLRRQELLLSGLDLWIPPEHYIDPARSDRALEAMLGAIELAADLAGLVAGSPSPVVSTAFPEGLDAAMKSEIAARAELAGVRIADHSLQETVGEADDGASPLAIGIDPAAHLLAGRDPAAAAARAGVRLASARLSDAGSVGRVAVGAAGSRLDVLAYLAALSAVNHQRPLVLDLRGIADQRAAVEAVSSSWRA